MVNLVDSLLIKHVNVEKKMQVFNKTTDDHDLAIERVDKVVDISKTL